MPSCQRPLPWIALTLALSGCGGNVVVDDNAAAPASNALLMKAPDPGGICTVQATTDPPGAVFLLVASRPITCAHPELLPDLNCPADKAEQSASALWEACIPLQPTLAPTKIDFTAYDPDVVFVHADAWCASFSVGVLQKGALAVTTVDPSSMTLTLSGATHETLEGTFNPDGTYEALRCP